VGGAIFELVAEFAQKSAQTGQQSYSAESMKESSVDDGSLRVT
jgi:hypothetical protein